jgi:hypothetical protein
MIHVNRSGTNLGIFSEEDVREGLRTGRFVSTDLGWREGMAQWQPLSQFPEFAGVPDAPGESPPVTPPATPPPEPRGRTGLPWEHRQERGFVNAFIETLQMVLTKPDPAFRMMKTEGSLADPILYALIGGCIGGIVSFLFSLGFQSMGMFVERRNTLAMMAGMGAGSIFFLILLPVMIVLVLFIGSAIIHLCLMLVGGANKSFETTLRVLGFVQGATGPLQMIPVCGGFIAAIWALVLNCIGLARAHETDTGRAVLAVFLPMIVCCGTIFVIALFVPALVHMSHH